MADNFLDNNIKAGSTSVSITFQLRKSADNTAETGKVAADCTAYYCRQGGVATAITLADLGSVNAAYSSGGMKEIDGTNMPGLYRLDVPNAAVASGADWVDVLVKTAASWQSQRFGLGTFAGLSDVIMDTVVESAGSYTVQQALSVMLAVLAGVTTSSGATIKTPDGSATRVTATINGSDERTAMTLSPSA